MLTKDQIVSQLKKEGVKLGRSNPSRTFDLYRQLGLIPRDDVVKTNINGKFTVLYPDHTVSLIKNVKKYLADGRRLSEIAEGLQESRSTLKEWARVLGGDPRQVTNIRRHIIREEKMHYFVSVFYSDRIDWLKVNKMVDPYHIDKDMQVLDTKTLSWEQYGEFVGKLAARLAREKHSIIRDKDILLAIFS